MNVGIAIDLFQLNTIHLQKCYFLLLWKDKMAFPSCLRWVLEVVKLVQPPSRFSQGIYMCSAFKSSRFDRLILASFSSCTFFLPINSFSIKFHCKTTNPSENSCLCRWPQDSVQMWFTSYGPISLPSCFQIIVTVVFEIQWVSFRGISLGLITNTTLIVPRNPFS